MKRYTTLGMATDQGKMANINGLALLSKARGQSIPRLEPRPTVHRSHRSALVLLLVTVLAQSLSQPVTRAHIGGRLSTPVLS